MNYSNTQYKKLKNLFDNTQDVFVIHWSRQNLTDNEGGFSTPRIIGIIIRSLNGAITKTFAIHLEAEKAGLTSEDIDTYYDQLEEQVLKNFIVFTEQYSTNIWVHWDSDDPHVGFEAIDHRYRVLYNKGVEEGEQEEIQNTFKIPLQNRINLNSCLKEIYGLKYEKPPQLQNLIKSNNDGQLVNGILALEDEARAFNQSRYPQILQSLQKKADFLIDTLRKTVDKKLVVSNKNILYKIEKFYTSFNGRDSLVSYCYQSNFSFYNIIIKLLYN